MCYQEADRSVVWEDKHLSVFFPVVSFDLCLSRAVIGQSGLEGKGKMTMDVNSLWGAFQDNNTTPSYSLY